MEESYIDKIRCIKDHNNLFLCNLTELYETIEGTTTHTAIIDNISNIIIYGAIRCSYTADIDGVKCSLGSDSTCEINHKYDRDILICKAKKIPSI